MKRRIAIITLLLLLCFGCAPALQSGAIQTQTPVQTAILTPEPTPEPTANGPRDLPPIEFKL